MPAPSRIAVVGSSGSGKSTVAGQIAVILAIRHVELDALHWKPGWTEAADDEFHELVDKATDNHEWVVDGNYGVVRDLVWRRANVLVWLDYSFLRTLVQLVRRTVSRVITGEELWAGNRETLSDALGTDSIIVWLFRSYRRHRRQYPELVRRPDYSHLEVVRLHHPSQTDAWLRDLARRVRSDPP
ncbi:MAG: adenylate kinase [Chloroflexota bacterium]